MRRSTTYIGCLLAVEVKVDSSSTSVRTYAYNVAGMGKGEDRLANIDLVER